MSTAMSALLPSPSSSDETAFTYKPLSAEADTRLIELEPAPDASSPLQCHIAELCLSSDDLVEYEALSYTWGEPEFTETLYVNEEKTSVIKITANLSDALQRVRLSDRKRLLWVDAVCINQKDSYDKEKQIPAMGRIFSAASHVLVWLGTSPQGQIALTDIKKALRFNSQESQRIETHLSNLEISFNDLVALPWFGRRWIIQEVVLAADVTLMCGPEELSLIHLFRVLSDFLRKKKLQPALEPLEAISRLWKTWVFDSNAGSGLRLFELLLLFHESDCQVDLDRIYALCNLAWDCEVVQEEGEDWINKIEVLVDYSQTADCLYQSVVEQILRLEEFYEEITEDVRGPYGVGGPAVDIRQELVCAVVERCDGSSRNTKLWVPDWRLPKKREPVFKFLDSADDHNRCFSMYMDLCDLERVGQPGNSSTVVQIVLEPFPEHPNMAEVKNWLQTMRDRFTDYQPQFPQNQFSRSGSKELWRFTQENSLLENFLLSDDRMLTDCVWCAFLFMTLKRGRWQRNRPLDPDDSVKEIKENARNLYLLSLGESEFQVSSECWSFLCRLFSARRIFFCRRNDDPYDTLYGAGIGPDHLKAGITVGYFLPRYNSTEVMDFETLLWHTVPGQEPALVGDAWVYNVDRGF